jgi:hypothetical protein
MGAQQATAVELPVEPVKKPCCMCCKKLEAEVAEEVEYIEVKKAEQETGNEIMRTLSETVVSTGEILEETGKTISQRVGEMFGFKKS